MRYLILTILLFVLERSASQSKKCDMLIQRGDTTICQHLTTEGLLLKEDFMLNGRRIFTRRWNYYLSGAFDCIQTIGKGPFAKPDGPYVLYYPAGNIQFSTFYRHGKQVGPTASYYPSGAVEYTILRQVLNEKWDGLVNFYYNNGAIQSKRIYRNGRLQTIFAYRDPAGNNLPVGTFSNGNGDWVFYVNGNPAITYTYRNGLLKKTKFMCDCARN